MLGKFAIVFTSLFTDAIVFAIASQIYIVCIVMVIHIPFQILKGTLKLQNSGKIFKFETIIPNLI